MRHRPVPPDGTKRVRRRFAVRRRYKRARWVAAAAGALVAALTAEAALARLGVEGIAPDEGFTLGAGLLILFGAVIPWLLVEGLWRWARRRYFWDWQ